MEDQASPQEPASQTEESWRATISAALAENMELLRSSIGEMVQEAVYRSTPPLHPTVTQGGSVPSGSTFSGSSNQDGGLRVGQLPPSSALSSVPLVSTGTSIRSSSGLNIACLTSVSDHLPHIPPIMSSSASQSAAEAVVVGASSPPVPFKLAQRIWEQKYVGMEELLPCKLGSEPTFLDTLTSSLKNKPTRKIESINRAMGLFIQHVHSCHG